MKLYLAALAVIAVLASVLIPVIAIYADDPLERLERSILEIDEAHYDPFFDPGTKTLVVVPLHLKLAMRWLDASMSGKLPDPENAGQITVTGREISIDPTMSYDAQQMVLAHELGHIFQPIGFTQYGEGEMFSSAVAYLVVLHESDEVDYFATYLARYKQHIHILRTHRKEIQVAATVIWGD